MEIIKLIREKSIHGSCLTHTRGLVKGHFISGLGFRHDHRTIPGGQHLAVQVRLWPMFAGLEELLQPCVEQGPYGLHLQTKAGGGQLQRIPDGQHVLALQLPLGVLRKTALV